MILRQPPISLGWIEQRAEVLLLHSVVAAALAHGWILNDQHKIPLVVPVVVQVVFLIA